MGFHNDFLASGSSRAAATGMFYLVKQPKRGMMQNKFADLNYEFINFRWIP